MQDHVSSVVLLYIYVKHCKFLRLNIANTTDAVNMANVANLAHTLTAVNAVNAPPTIEA